MTGKGNWGGRRPGAGRPQQGVTRKRISFALPNEQIAAVEEIAAMRRISKSAAVSMLLELALAHLHEGQ